MDVMLQANDLNGTIPQSWSKIQFLLLDASYNSLWGPLPITNLSSGPWKDMVYLNLASNIGLNGGPMWADAERLCVRDVDMKGLLCPTCAH